MSWSEATIGDFYKVASSKRVLKSDWKSDGIPFYRGREITSLSKYGFVENDLYITEKMYEEFNKNYGVPVAGDIMVTAIGTIGNTYIVRSQDKFYFKDASVLWLKKKKDIDSNFVNYWFKSSHFTNQLDVGLGATVDTLTIGKVQSLKIHIPSLSTQRKIVAKLDAILAEIDKAMAAAEANAKNAEALFQSYLNQVFESNNDGWTKKSLPSLCTLFNGRAYSKSELLDSGKYTVLRVGNFFTNEHWYYSDLELEENKYCDNGDLLYAWSASFGPRIWSGDKVIYHYHIWKVVPHSDVIDKMFLFYLLEWDVDKIKKDHGTGATMIHVSKKSMESRVLPYVDLESQRSIVLRLDSMKNYTKNLKSQYNEKVKVLSDYKKSILKNAFNGEFIKD